MLKKLFERRSKSKVDFYKSIEELPVWNWNQVNKSSDLKFLVRGVDYSEDPEFDKLKASELWLDLHQQYIDEFGISSKYKQFLRLQKEMTLLQADAILTGDRTKNTFAKAKKREIETFFETEENTTFAETIAILERELSFGIDPKKISVMKYFTHLKLINDKAARMKAARRKKEAKR